MSTEQHVDWFERLPMAVAVIRVQDQVVVSANRRALELFGYSTDQIGTITLWDVVAEVDWNELSALETAGAREGREESEGFDREDSTVGLITLRGPNQKKFVAWVMASAIYDDDGLVRHRAAIILNESMNQDFVSLREQSSDLTTRNYYSDLLSNSAHEINNSLMSVIEIVKNLAMSQTDSDIVNRALSRITEVGELMVKLGDKSVLQPTSGSDRLEPAVRPMKNSLKVLIVDDGLDLLEILDSLLSTAGYVVTTASNLKDAEELCESESYDLALIDIQLGDDIGIVLAQQLVKDSPKTGVILMTGFTRHIEKYQDLPGVLLLRKPFPMYDLLEAIQKSLNRTS